MYVAVADEAIVGFVAGHLTTRFDCDGELEWINVVPGYRGAGTGALLFGRLAEWFVKEDAHKVCVDPDEPARAFYARLGAEPLDAHWMYWPDIAVAAARRPGS